MFQEIFEGRFNTIVVSESIADSIRRYASIFSKTPSQEQSKRPLKLCNQRNNRTDQPESNFRQVPNIISSPPVCSDSTWGLRGPSSISRFTGPPISFSPACTARETHAYSIKMYDLCAEENIVENGSMLQCSDNKEHRHPRSSHAKNKDIISLGGPGRKPRACEYSLCLRIISLANHLSIALRHGMPTPQDEM